MTIHLDETDLQAGAAYFAGQALAAFRQALAGENTLGITAGGIGHASRAACLGTDLRSLVPEIAREAPEVLFALSPRISDLLGEDVPRDRVSVGFAAVSSLFSAGADEFVEDRIHYAEILRSEIAMAFHRRRLSLRGDPFARHLNLRRAAAALPSEFTAYH